MHSKTGSNRLTQTGWGRTYTGRFATRPQIPNPVEAQQTIHQYVSDLKSKPQFHPDGLVPLMHVTKASMLAEFFFALAMGSGMSCVP